MKVKQSFKGRAKLSNVHITNPGSELKSYNNMNSTDRNELSPSLSKT